MDMHTTHTAAIILERMRNKAKRFAVSITMYVEITASRNDANAELLKANSCVLPFQNHARAPVTMHRGRVRVLLLT